MGSGDMEINLAALTAKVVLPDDLVKEKMTHVESYASKLSPRSAALLRQNALLRLRLVYFIKNMPKDGPPVDRAAKEVLLLCSISRVPIMAVNTQLSAVEGATVE